MSIMAVPIKYNADQLIGAKCFHPILLIYMITSVNYIGSWDLVRR